MFNVVLSEADVQFINEAASVLLPFYKAQMLMNNINGQVEQCKTVQKSQAQESIKAQIAEAVKVALADRPIVENDDNSPLVE